MLGLVASGHAAYALGVARRALDEAATIAKSRQRPPGPVLSDQPVFQDGYAHAEAKLLAARSFLLDSLDSAYDTVMAGEPYGLRERALVRLATSHATEVAFDVVSFAYHAAGTTALRNPSALQRCFRDINAATQHAFVDPSVWLNAAKILLGTAEEGTML
jgi:alkylation response protein AidB-like acyl-CoA dehydrogenase